jgi:bifunctional DNA-binding transcriptional regulator/antitoxin component of YhaV-PrlF toxin-antitoxin module
MWNNLKIEWTANIWMKWQIVIPKQARNKFNLNTWDDLVVLSGKFWIMLIKSTDLKDMMDNFENLIETEK